LKGIIGLAVAIIWTRTYGKRAKEKALAEKAAAAEVVAENE